MIKKLNLKSLTFSLVGLIFLSLNTNSYGTTDSYSESDFITNLEETYVKFINENSNKPLIYTNMAENYYSMIYIKSTGETIQLTQAKNANNTWEYETLICKTSDPEESEEKQECQRKTTNSNWETYINTNLKNTLARVMLEPITLTSFIIGDSKPSGSILTYTIKPGKNSNIYMSSYSSSDKAISGELRQEISARFYRLKLIEEKPNEKITNMQLQFVSQ